MTLSSSASQALCAAVVSPRRTSLGEDAAEAIRVTGTVQGVGFRPTVYRLAVALHLRGHVLNDGQGVLIHIAGPQSQINQFVLQLLQNSPPLARIACIQRQPLSLDDFPEADFRIIESEHTAVKTEIAPDAATCPQCLAEIFSPRSRYFRYPFTNCTHCGPRLSIIRKLPYDRASTSMAWFTLCHSCHREYEEVTNRRFHAQPTACPVCGPKVWLERADGKTALAKSLALLDEAEAVATLLQRGEIVAIKGLGGVHLACDATNEAAVSQLRQRKGRYHKPFALMVRDLAVMEPYCEISEVEAELLASSAAPIVLLKRKSGLEAGRFLDLGSQELGVRSQGLRKQELGEQELEEQESRSRELGSESSKFKIQNSNQNFSSGDAARTKFKINPPLAPSLAPNLSTLGVMLPYTPLHHLILQRLDRPLVMTSGNRSDEPQCITNEAVREQLGSIASHFVLHNRDIVNRVDDSVVRVVNGQAQILRRARGYAPAPLDLPPGFERVPSLLALGGELKSTFCLMRPGQAILSQHLGDLENAAAYQGYRQALELYLDLFEYRPEGIVVDEHPDYLSTKFGQELAQGQSIPLMTVQHHHAHIAACMADNGLPLATTPVLGIALDGLGYGDDQSLWGGEFLLADYRHYRRLAHLKPVAMLGGSQAMRQPWRSAYAHLVAAFGSWSAVQQAFPDLPLVSRLNEQPQTLLEAMLAKGLNSPLASSAGRLFDAVAAALGICDQSASYEGQGAMELEALIEPIHLQRAQATAYQFWVHEASSQAHSTDSHATPLILDPTPLWHSLLADMQRQTPVAVMAARFHVGLGNAIATLAHHLAQRHSLTTVALSGGVFQNQILATQVQQQLQAKGLQVLTHHQIPPNDGGLSLGQATIAAAQSLPPPP